jgi:hypothetical protein
MQRHFEYFSLMFLRERKILKRQPEVPFVPRAGDDGMQPQQEGRVDEVLDAYAKRWMAQVIADTAHQRSKEREEQRAADAKTARERLTPLDDRLARLLATIPIEVQHEGLSLSSLQASLRGRSRGKCHPGELGAALRRLGFERRRDWSSVEGFRAMWYKVR